MLEKLNLADYVGLPWTEFEAKINEQFEKPKLYPLASVVEDVPSGPPVPLQNPDSHIVTDIAPVPKKGSERKVEVDPTSIGVVIEPPPIQSTPTQPLPMASLSVEPAPSPGLPLVRGVWCLLGVVASSVTGAAVALAGVPASGTAGAGTVTAGDVVLAIGAALVVGVALASVGQVRGLRRAGT